MLTGSPNFSLREVTAASDSVPLKMLQSEPYPENVARLLATMEGVRATLGHKPITLTSVARSETRNEDVGGSESSAHLRALAADFTVAGMTPVEVCATLRPAMRALKIDQLILYDTHTHVSADPRGRAQFLDKRTGTGNPITATSPTPAAPSLVSAPGCGTVVVIALAPLVLSLAVFL